MTRSQKSLLKSFQRSRHNYHNHNQDVCIIIIIIILSELSQNIFSGLDMVNISCTHIICKDLTTAEVR